MSNGAQTQFDTPDDFANAIKRLNPSIAAMPNLQVAQKALAAHPEYWQRINAANFAAKGIWQTNAGSDPYAAYGGQITQAGGADPYASYGGKTITQAPASKPLPSQQTMDAAFIQRMKAMPKSTKPAPAWEGSNRNIMDVRGAGDYLPGAGMAVGSMVGGGLGGPPGAMVGAGVGGAAGEWAKQKLAGKKTDAGKIYDVGVTGALTDVAGGVALKGMEKGVAAIAPKAAERANVLIDRLLKPSVKKLIAGTGSKVETADAIAAEVNKVAPGARTLPQLKQNVDSAIKDLTMKTQAMVDQYKPTISEQGLQAVTGVTRPGQKLLTSGSDMIPRTSLVKPEMGVAADAAQPTVKMFTKQGGIPLRRILQASALKTAGELSETEVANKNKVVARLAQMIYQHAGKDEITPSEALQLRRWLYSNVKWPKAALGMRDDIYHTLNRQIESFLQPEDAAAFRDNNASVHKLLRARDAIDLRSLEQNRRGVHLTHRWWVLPLVGSSAGGALGYAAGGGKGAAEGAGIGAGIGELGSLGFGLAETQEGILARAAVNRAKVRAGKKAAETVVPVLQQLRKTFTGTQP